MVMSQFKCEKAITSISITEGQNLFVIGDIHGQFEDLVRIFEQNGYPTVDRKFIFNGDIVDRGPASIECLMTLFMMKVCCPTGLFITRGNHESHTCGHGSFKEECFSKMSQPVTFFTAFHDIFTVLPLGYIIQDKYFVSRHLIWICFDSFITFHFIFIFCIRACRCVTVVFPTGSTLKWSERLINRITLPTKWNLSCHFCGMTHTKVSEWRDQRGAGRPYPLEATLPWISWGDTGSSSSSEATNITKTATFTPMKIYAWHYFPLQITADSIIKAW